MFGKFSRSSEHGNFLEHGRNFLKFDEISQDIPEIMQVHQKGTNLKSRGVFLKMFALRALQTFKQINILIFLILVSSEERVFLLFFARRANFFGVFFARRAIFFESDFKKILGRGKCN